MAVGCTKNASVKSETIHECISECSLFIARQLYNFLTVGGTEPICLVLNALNLFLS